MKSIVTIKKQFIEMKSLIEFEIIKKSITPSVVSSIKKIVATWNSIGCFVIYRDTKFLITVKHSFVETLSNGNSIEISICRNQWVKFEGIFYKHSDADIAAVQITKEGFIPKNYIQLSDETIKLKAGDKFTILGYQNVDKMNCSEKPILQKSIFLYNSNQYQDIFSGVAIPGYSGSPILLLGESSGSIDLVGLLSKSGNDLVNIGSNKDLKEEGDEIIIENLNVISTSRLAILETLNLAFTQPI
jgi:hypothetical protein